MPSIDRLVAARYGPTAPHPLRRRPWRPAPPVAPASMSERVRRQLVGADRARRYGRTSRLAAWVLSALVVCAGAGVVLRWPRLGVAVIHLSVHALGSLLITLTALRRVRDGLFAPSEMSQLAGVVTVLLLLLVAAGLGCVLWQSASPSLDRDALSGHRGDEGLP